MISPPKPQAPDGSNPPQSRELRLKSINRRYRRCLPGIVRNFGSWAEWH
jgi:hypothetical protein